ncbi:hypothetical protein C8J57DRAFT_1246652 [Mycena rebaudengoi]|nr:hypothetical protein C8J57DRAFT_1246652 [Mycena rebaudengoi]
MELAAKLPGSAACCASVGVKNVPNEAPARRNRHGDRHMGMLHKHVQSDSRDFVKRTDNARGYTVAMEMVYMCEYKRQREAQARSTERALAPPTHAAAYTKIAAAELEAENNGAASQVGDTSLITDGLLLERDQAYAKHTLRMLGKSQDDDLVGMVHACLLYYFNQFDSHASQGGL